MITTRIGQACLALALGAVSFIADAAPDTLLEQIRSTYATAGANRVAEMARGLGVSLRTENNRLMVPVIVDREASRTRLFSSRLALAGARVDASSRSWVRLLVPASSLDKLISLFPDQRLRAPIPVFPAFGEGTIVSQSVSLTAADGYQAGNLDGSGTRIAIIDLGFSGLSNTINAGELPADTVSVDFTGDGVEAGGKHGVGVAEQVADMAPGARLYCLRVSDLVSLQNAADYLRQNNIPIANHSVSWVTASYYDDTGPVNDIINGSHDNDGIFWAVAAGNYGRRHWRGAWQDSDGDNRLEFSGTDELMALSGTGGTISLFLNWNQYGANNKTDLDLYLLDKNGVAVASSTVVQSRFNNPVESISYTYDSAEAPYDVVVQLTSGNTANLDITLFSFSHNLEHYVAASSVSDPASAHGAFTVGAVSQSVWNNANPAIRSYSSQGPTTDGRQKPDLVAPDGTSSLTYSTASGTSFSSPVTAGAAALLLSEDGSRSAVDLATLLHAQAIDVGAGGVDPVFGYGKLQLPLIDSDGDGLNNVEEIQLGTDALQSDSDGDGLDDFAEVRTWGTDPLNADSDGDGLSDYEEVVTLGTDPLASNRGDLAPHGAPDDTIDLGDYLVLTRLVSGAIPATATETTLGDLNNNGGLDAGDMVLLLRVIQGEIPMP